MLLYETKIQICPQHGNCWSNDISMFGLNLNAYRGVSEKSRIGDSDANRRVNDIEEEKDIVGKKSRPTN